jgi:hypothetical protein
LRQPKLRPSLCELVGDMRVLQAADEQCLGIADQARNHAEDRHQKGYIAEQVVSGYRALRTSIVRRWIDEMTGADRGAPDELVRFHDAVDRALTESVRRYSDGLTGPEPMTRLSPSIRRKTRQTLDEAVHRSDPAGPARDLTGDRRDEQYDR